jgi:hypothetical protein
LISTGRSAAEALPHLLSCIDCSSLLEKQLEEVDIALPSSVVQRCFAILYDAA